MPKQPDYVNLSAEEVVAPKPVETVDHRVPKAIDQAVRVLAWRHNFKQGRKVPLRGIIDECMKHGVKADEVRLFVKNNPAVVLAPAQIKH